MNQQEMQRFVSNYVVTNKGVFQPDEVAAEITKLANMCPEATAKDKGLTTELEKAYETIMIQQGGGAEGAPAVTETKAEVTTTPTSMISVEEQTHIAKTLMAQREARSITSTTTSIEKLVLDRPDPASYIKEGTKGMISQKSFANILKKLEDGVYQLCPDDGENVEADKRIASTTNFNALKAAYESGTPVDVRIGNLSTKAIGYIVRKGNTNGTDTTPVQMTRESLERFVIMETDGFIMASDGKPGAKLRYVNGKADATDIGAAKKGYTTIADTNKKEAIEKGSYVVSKAAQGEEKEQTCKSELAFKVVDTQKTKKNSNENIVRTIRVSVTAVLPTLVRLPEYLDVFGTGERESNADLKQKPTGDMAKNITEAQINAIAELRQKSMVPTSMRDFDDIADKLAAFDVKSSAPSNVAM